MVQLFDLFLKEQKSYHQSLFNLAIGVSVSSIYLAINWSKNYLFNLISANSNLYMLSTSSSLKGPINWQEKLAILPVLTKLWDIIQFTMS